MAYMAVEGFCSVLEARELGIDMLMALSEVLNEMYESRKQATGGKR